MKAISRTVWILSLVSLFNDMASEMLYPIMPIYLQSIGFSILLIGILEGIIEAISGLSRGYFGRWSDYSGHRVPFVQIGYMLSSVSKPLLAVSAHPLWVLFARAMDRTGKGIRTSPRDALLSDESTPQTKAKVFGFHRSIDTVGALLGPPLALLFLFLNPGNYQTLFLLTLIPGMLAISATYFIRENTSALSSETLNHSHTPRWSFFLFMSYWKQSSPAYRNLVMGLLAFTLVNSSNVFLLLRAKETGIDDTTVIGLYMFYNLVYAAFAYPMGAIADKIGLKYIYMLGLGIFALVYMGLGLTNDLYAIFGLFLLYGIFGAATEGVSIAWISLLTPKKDMATAIGTFGAFQSIGLMLASTLTGLLWQAFGSAIALGVSAGVSVLVMAYIATLPNHTATPPSITPPKTLSQTSIS